MTTNHERKLTNVKEGIHTTLPVDSIGLLLRQKSDGTVQGYLTASRYADGYEGYEKDSFVLQPVTPELYDHLHQCIEGLTKGFLMNELKLRNY